MPTLTIDRRQVTVPLGTSVLDAAAQLGLEIPTLCFLDGYEPSTSCQVCMVKDLSTGRLVSACATKVVEGMRIESETDEVHSVRRTALELLLSDHVGDCVAPCFFACPAHMDIPLMLHRLATSICGRPSPRSSGTLRCRRCWGGSVPGPARRDAGAAPPTIPWRSAS